MSFSCIFRHALVTLLILSIASGAAASPTNMDLLTETLEQVVEQALSEMEVPEIAPQASLLIQPQTKHAANWMVDHILADRLLARGFAVTFDSTTVQADQVRLAYRILDLGITGRSGLRGGQIDRQSRVTLALSLSRDNALHWQDEFREVKADRIPKGRLDLLENASYSFAKTELEEQSWSKFVEPIIISTVLGGLIYLFFSNR